MQGGWGGKGWWELGVRGRSAAPARLPSSARPASLSPQRTRRSDLPAQDAGKGSGPEPPPGQLKKGTGQRLPSTSENEPSSDVELTFAPGSERGRNPAESGVLGRDHSPAGHLCRLLGGLQGPGSCGALRSKAMGITNPGAPSTETGPRCSFVCRSELRLVPPQPGDILSRFTASPPLFLTGNWGAKQRSGSGSCREGRALLGSGEPRETPGATKPTANQSNETFGATDSQGTVPVRGSEAERWKSSRSSARFPAAGREGSLLRTAWLCPAPRVPALTCSGLQHVEVPLPSRIPPAAGAGLWRVRNLIRGELPAPAEPRAGASPAAPQTQRRARHGALHPAPTPRNGEPS